MTSDRLKKKTKNMCVPSRGARPPGHDFLCNSRRLRGSEVSSCPGGVKHICVVLTRETIESGVYREAH